MADGPRDRDWPTPVPHALEDWAIDHQLAGTRMGPVSERDYRREVTELARRMGVSERELVARLELESLEEDSDG